MLLFWGFKSRSQVRHTFHALCTGERRVKQGQGRRAVIVSVSILGPPSEVLGTHYISSFNLQNKGL